MNDLSDIFFPRKNDRTTCYLKSVVKNERIIGGVPAKLRGKRFSEEVIELLEKIEWWNWEIEKIKAHLDLLTGNDAAQLAEMV